MQVVQVHLQTFRCKWLLKCVTQPEIAKKITKTPIFRVQCHSRSSMLTPRKSLSQLLVMISSMSVPICNRFHATRANSNKITTLWGGQRSLMPACASLLEPRGLGLGLLKSTFNAENFIRRLSWSISSHSSAIQRWNVRCIQKLWKIHLKPILGVQGHRCW